MVKFEKSLGFVVIVALVFKYFHLQGGGILLTFSLMSLACLYYLFGFAFFNQIDLNGIFDKKSYQGISTFRILTAIGAGIGLSCICLGILFMFQHWPGANIILSAGLILTFIILFISLIRFFTTERADFYKLIFIRIAVIGGFGLTLLLCR